MAVHVQAVAPLSLQALLRPFGELVANVVSRLLSAFLLVSLAGRPEGVGPLVPLLARELPATKLAPPREPPGPGTAPKLDVLPQEQGHPVHLLERITQP